jgi:hypothetical protein
MISRLLLVFVKEDNDTVFACCIEEFTCCVEDTRLTELKVEDVFYVFGLVDQQVCSVEELHRLDCFVFLKEIPHDSDVHTKLVIRRDCP